MNSIIICPHNVADEVSAILGEKIIKRQRHRDSSAITLPDEDIKLLPESILALCSILAIKEDIEYEID